MLAEFRKFVMRGNVLDLAVAVIIGGAFGRIIGSLVNDIIMPVIGLLVGGVNFSSLRVILRAETETAQELAISYGQFIQTTVDFIIIAFVIFLVIRAVVSQRKQEAAAPAPPPPPAPEVLLLTEIRDLLKTGKPTS